MVWNKIKTDFNNNSIFQWREVFKGHKAVGWATLDYLCLPTHWACASLPSALELPTPSILLIINPQVDSLWEASQDLWHLLDRINPQIFLNPIVSHSSYTLIFHCCGLCGARDCFCCLWPLCPTTAQPRAYAQYPTLTNKCDDDLDSSSLATLLAASCWTVINFSRALFPHLEHIEN